MRILWWQEAGSALSNKTILETSRSRRSHGWTAGGLVAIHWIAHTRFHPLKMSTSALIFHSCESTWLNFSACSFNSITSLGKLIRFNTVCWISWLIRVMNNINAFLCRLEWQGEKATWYHVKVKECATKEPAVFWVHSSQAVNVLSQQLHSWPGHSGLK